MQITNILFSFATSIKYKYITNSKQKANQMKVPKEITSKWSDMIDIGDKKAIELETGLSQPTIRKAIEDGEASEETIIKINDFFKVKKERIKNLTK